MSPRKVIHIVSTGCVASTYTGRQIKRHPMVYRYFNEPFNKKGVRQKWKNHLILCLFLNQCTDQKINRFRLGITSKDIDIMQNATIVFKTTQFTAFNLLYDLVFKQNIEILDHYYLIYLTRDPRATYNSCKQHPKWDENDPIFLCDKFMEIYNSLIQLIHTMKQNKLPQLKIITIYSEFIATLYPQQYRDLLFKFTEMDLNLITYRENEKLGYNKTAKIIHSNTWIKQLDFNEIQMIQNISSCSQWIKHFGYNVITKYDKNYKDKLLSIDEMIDTKNPFPFKQFMLKSAVDNHLEYLNEIYPQQNIYRFNHVINEVDIIEDHNAVYLTILYPALMICVFYIFVALANKFKIRMPCKR